MSLFTYGSSDTTAYSGLKQFPDPFFDYASMAMPKTHLDVLDFCERLTFANGIYMSALKRVVGFFVTEVTLSGGSRDEREKYRAALNNTLGIRDILRQVGLNYLCYGNVFASVMMRFRRYLACPRCGFDAPLRNIRDHRSCRFAWTNYRFHATCPKCSYTGSWQHRDRRSTQEKDLVVKFWAPKEVEIRYERVYETTRYLWKIPSLDRQQVTAGEELALENYPWEIIETIQARDDLKFNPDLIYHLKHPTLAGILNRGWGLPPCMSAFRQCWYVQVLHRFNEAIGMDYVMPLRIITPQPRPGGAGPENSDPMFNSDLSSFANHMGRILKTHRSDPTDWHVSPFPVQYQIMGAEATQLAPYQLLELGRDDLLNTLDIPVEFYKGSLSIQAAPLALRLMESNWSHLTFTLNRFLQWLLDRISELMSWEKVTGRLERPSQIDDLNRQLAKLQLMAAGELSRTTGMQTLGLDFESELRRKYEEQAMEADVAEEEQDKQEGKQVAQAMSQPIDPNTGQPVGAAPPQGGAPAGAPAGAPPAGGAGAPMAPGQDPVEQVLSILPSPTDPTVTLPELQASADAIAYQAKGMLSTQKLSLLRRLKTRHEAVHALVKSRLDQFKQQQEAQGRAMAEAAPTGPAAGQITASPTAMAT